MRVAAVEMGAAGALQRAGTLLSLRIEAVGLGWRAQRSEETEVHPKPTVEIGEKPLLWQILKVCPLAAPDTAAGYSQKWSQ